MTQITTGIWYHTGKCWYHTGGYCSLLSHRLVMTSLLTCMKEILHFTFFITDPSNVRTMTQRQHSVYIFTDSGFLFGVPSFFSVEERMTSWWRSDNSWVCGFLGVFSRAGFGPECRSWFCGWPQWRHSDAVTTQCMFFAKERVSVQIECRTWFCGWPQWCHDDTIKTVYGFYTEQVFVRSTVSVFRVFIFGWPQWRHNIAIKTQCMFLHRAGFCPEWRTWFSGWPQWRHGDAMKTHCVVLHRAGFWPACRICFLSVLFCFLTTPVTSRWRNKKHSVCFYTERVSVRSAVPGSVDDPDDVRDHSGLPQGQRLP